MVLKLLAVLNGKIGYLISRKKNNSWFITVFLCFSSGKEECTMPSSFGSFSGRPAQSISKSFRASSENCWDIILTLGFLPHRWLFLGFCTVFTAGRSLLLPNPIWSLLHANHDNTTTCFTQQHHDNYNHNKYNNHNDKNNYLYFSNSPNHTNQMCLAIQLLCSKSLRA